MDLAALWSHEKARLGPHLGTGVQDPSVGSSGSASIAVDERGARHRLSSDQPLARSDKKKKNSTETSLSSSPLPHNRRDKLFHRLLVESVAPARSMVFGRGDRNEFAIEYADRASRRFNQHCGAGNGDRELSSSELIADSAHGAANGETKHGRRRGNGLLLGSAREISSTATHNNSLLSPSTTAAALAAMAGIPQRRHHHNARKRGGGHGSMELAAHAFKPYVGDMFGTRGDYVEGMLYMSRMKRSHQLTFGNDIGSSTGTNMVGLASASVLRSAISGVVSASAVASSAGSLLLGGTSSSSTKVASGENIARAAANTSSSGNTKNSAGASLKPKATVMATDASSPEALSPEAKLQLEHRQRCALTLSNWSSNPANAALMVQEHVVDALMQLASQARRDRDYTTRLHCVTALMNLSHVTESRTELVQQGAVATIAEIAGDCEERVIRTACAVTLANLCSLQGDEARLVEHGAASALSLLVNERPDVAGICLGALFNLTCVREPYHKIEVILKIFVTLASSSSSNSSATDSGMGRDELTARALCNLSNFKRVRLRLLEEGIVPALTSLIRPQRAFMQKLLAYVLLNLSSVRACRGELVAKGCIGALVALTGATRTIISNRGSSDGSDPNTSTSGDTETDDIIASARSNAITKYLIALTLWNLSKEPSNRLRMVFEGLLLLVNELCRETVDSISNDDIVMNNQCRPPTFSGETTATPDALRSVCTRTVYNVSCSDETRVKLVERDAVPVLSMLSRSTILSSGDDISNTNDVSAGSEAQRMATLALCNLLSVQQAAAAIMTAGAVTSLVKLSMTPQQTLETRHVFAKALCGLCERSSTRGAVVQAGILPALLHLCATQNKEEVTGSANPPSTNGTILARQAGLLSEIRARCMAALTWLAADAARGMKTNGRLGNGGGTGLGTIDVVRCVTRVLELERFNVAIERFCCSCLSLLARDETCARLIADEGAVAAVLATCMESQDLETKASCCHVLASMSCHGSGCLALVELGALSSLTILSHIKGDAAILRCCAITLANLSTSPATRSILVTAGSVSLLAALSNSYSEENQRDCAKVLCNLSCIADPDVEGTLVHDGAIPVLLMIAMVRALQPGTKEMCVRAFANLATSREAVEVLVRDGLVAVLPALSTALPNSSATRVMLALYCKLLGYEAGRNALCRERAALRALFALMERPPINDSHTGGDGDADENDKGCDARDAAQDGNDDARATTEAAINCIPEDLLCTLVSNDESRECSVAAGIVDALHRRASQLLPPAYRDGDGFDSVNGARARKLASALFELAKHDSTRRAAASPLSLATLKSFLVAAAPYTQTVQEPSEQTMFGSVTCTEYIISTCCCLAWNDDTRESLEPPTTTSAIIELLGRPPTCLPPDSLSSSHSPSVIKTCVLTLCCLAQNPRHIDAMLRDYAISRMYGVLLDLPPEENAELAALVAMLFRQLGHSPKFVGLMRDNAESTEVPTVLALFCRLVDAVTAPPFSLSGQCGTENQGRALVGLDCADALCSMTFVPSLTFGSTPSSGLPSSVVSPSVCTFFVEREMAQTSRKPLSTPVSSKCSSGMFIPAYPPAALVCVNVLRAIGALLATPMSIPATRWRCVAALHALTCVLKHRHQLVALGCTALLVAEAYRSSLPPTAVSQGDEAVMAKHIVHGCAGALSNLTLVEACHADANAAAMVCEGAIPALIHLASTDRDDLREYCTLALSNLSSQSPTVESGAVSALLSLSLHGGDLAHQANSLSTVNNNDKTQLKVSHLPGPDDVRRPPEVQDERHKIVASLPDLTMALPCLDVLRGIKFEAEPHISEPPLPHPPTIPADLEMLGAGAAMVQTTGPCGGSMSNQSVFPSAARPTSPVRDDLLLKRCKSSSYGDLTGMSPLSTPAPSRGCIGGTAYDGLRGWETISFPKMETDECRALMIVGDSATLPTGRSDISGIPGAPGSSKRTQSTPLSPQSSLGVLSSPSTPSNEYRREKDRDDRDTRTERNVESDTRIAGKGNTAQLSPLAQVVLRKTQTDLAAKKLRDHLGVGTAHGRLASLPASSLMSSTSTPLLPLSTVQESASVSLRHTITRQHEVEECVNGSIAAAAAAAMLYSAGPHGDSERCGRERDSGRGGYEKLLAAWPEPGVLVYSSAKMNKGGKTQGNNCKKKKKKKVVVSSPNVCGTSTAMTESVPQMTTVSPLQQSAPVMEEVSSVSDVQEQVKRLGLWA